MKLGAWFLPALLLAPPLLSAGGTASRQRPAPGDFLVARRNLPDPNFAETVVLLVQADEKGAMGLIVNRQTDVPLSRALRQIPEAAQRKDPAYAGGPVMPAGVLALLRTAVKPAQARRVFADVYLVSDIRLFKETLAAGAKSDAFRVYFGYAGWRAGQLEREIELGMWHVFEGDAAQVFDAEPDTLWARLIRRTEWRIASAARP